MAVIFPTMVDWTKTTEIPKLLVRSRPLQGCIPQQEDYPKRWQTPYTNILPRCFGVKKESNFHQISVFIPPIILSLKP